MAKMRSLWLLVVILIPAFVIAQKTDIPESEKRQRLTLLIEQIVSDAQNLRLGENRAVVYARAGGAIWKSDQKNGATLFENAVSELINAQTAAENDRKTFANKQDLLQGQSTRPQVLQTIATRDAVFALQSLYRSRPAAIERALLGPAANTGKIVGNGPNDFSLAQSEMSLEQRLIRLAADQNPDLAKALLIETLKKELTGETLGLLKKLFEKDPEEANRLASDVTGRLLAKQFTINDQADYQAVQLSINILMDFIGDHRVPARSLKFDESQMKELADKLISFSLENVSRNTYSQNPQLLKIAEKLSPSWLKLLRKAQKSAPRGGGQIDPGVAKLLSGKSTGDQLLADAKTYPLESRGPIYQMAANKLSQEGDFGRANEILRENFSGAALDNAISSLNWFYAHYLMNTGKYKEAEAVMDDLIDGNRQAALIELAQRVISKDPEKNKTYALSLLGKALGPEAERPENSNEMARLMRVISVYAAIEPGEGFRLFESVVPQMNELADAAAVLYGFQGSGSLKQGEFLITSGGGSFGANVDFSVLRTLSQIDFERTLAVINGFNHREMRIALKQQLADGLVQMSVKK